MGCPAPVTVWVLLSLQVNGEQEPTCQIEVIPYSRPEIDEKLPELLRGPERI